MGFLEKFLNASPADIDDQIEQVQQDQQAKRERLKAIKQEMALAYGDQKQIDQLKNELVGLQAELESLPVVLEGLQKQREQATIRELFADRREIDKQYKDSLKQLDKAGGDLITRVKGLITTFERYEQALNEREAVLKRNMQNKGRLKASKVNQNDWPEVDLIDPENAVHKRIVDDVRRLREQLGRLGLL